MAIIYLLRLLDPNHQYIKIGILSQKTIKEIHHFEENEYIPHNHVIPHIKDYLLIYKGIFPFDNQDYQHIFEKKDNIIQIYQNGNIYVDFNHLRYQIFMNQETSVLESYYPYIFFF
jgi:hypothetical protein